MKKGIMILGAMALSFTGFSQSAYDALSVNQLDPLLGTARYTSMAGAFGALGGNSSSAKDNPAGIGVYKCFDISFTPNLYLDNDKELSVGLNNFSLIINFRNHEEREKGYITSSLGITYSRLRNFSRYSGLNSLNYNGSSLSDAICSVNSPDVIFNAADDLGLVGLNGDGDYVSNFSLYDNYDKKSRFIESGKIGQWDFSYGMNISNRVYLGAAFGVTNLTYSQKALYEEESTNDSKDMFYLDNYYRADGYGCNFKLGAIVKATDFLRAGFAIHTPTIYTLDEEYSIEMDYNNQYPNQPEIEHSYLTYTMRTPFKMQGSLGFVIGKRALIGAEYNYDDFSSMRIKNDGVKNENECDIIQNEFNKVHTMKLGAEVKVIDEFALRAGYAYMSSPMDYIAEDWANKFMMRSYSIPQQVHYITAGAGYEGEHFYCDVAYMFRNQEVNYFPMVPQDETASIMNLKNHNISATLGWRF